MVPKWMSLPETYACTEYWLSLFAHGCAQEIDSRSGRSCLNLLYSIFNWPVSLAGDRLPVPSHSGTYSQSFLLSLPFNSIRIMGMGDQNRFKYRFRN